MSGSNSEQQSAFTKPCSQPCIPYASRLPCKFMSHDGRAHELARSRIIIGFEYNTPAKSQACPRTANLLQHTPNLSFEEKDGVSALAQFSTTRRSSPRSKRPSGLMDTTLGLPPARRSRACSHASALWTAPTGASFEEKETRVKR